MENLRPILWLSLAFVLFLMWQAWNQDYGVRPQPTAPQMNDTVTQDPDFVPEDVPEAVAGEIDSAAPSAQPDTPVAADTRRRQITVRTDLLDMVIDTRGGTIVQADLLGFPVDLTEPPVPVRLFDERVRGYVAQSGLTHDRLPGIETAGRAPSHHAVFTTDSNRFELAPGQDSLRVPMTWTSEDGRVQVTKTFVFTRGSHLVEVEHVVRNLGDEPWVGRQYRQLRHGPTPSRESFFLYTFTGAAYFDGKYNKEDFESLRQSPVEKRIEGGWISIIQHYFMSAWIPRADEVSAMYGRAVQAATGLEYLVGLHSEPITVAPGETGTFSTRLWVGPKSQMELREIAQGLELTVDYGIFTFLSKPLFWLLRVIHDFVGNWGWSIIILTILIKLAFFHLSATSYRSMAKMRAVAPKLQAMKERYKDDKQRMNTALMELYKKEKINPLGGCLPILVQIPVFIALYWVLLESVEMRQAPWILWIQDLSTRDPYFILPILMGLTMIIQYKLNPPPMDPIQKKIFMALPFVFTVFFAFFPAGLVLYWFTNNLFSIGQQYVITRRIDAAAGKKD
jgi:YidC/Oxa1 family membrane protein insertase